MLIKCDPILLLKKSGADLSKHRDIHSLNKANSRQARLVLSFDTVTIKCSTSLDKEQK